MKRTIIAAALINGMLATAVFAAGGDRGRGFDFSAIDADQSGTITTAEVAAFHAARFAQADANGDGFIAEDELIGLIPEGADVDQERAQKRLLRMSAHLDADDDGQISLEEFSADDRQTRMFERLDADENGELSAEELEKVKKRGKKDKRGHGKRDGNRGGSNGSNDKT